MLNRKFIITFIIALIALIVIGFFALRFVPTGDLMDVDLSGNITNETENATMNLSDSQIDAQLNKTINATENITDINVTALNVTADDLNDTNSSSDIDAGDVLHKQTFTISGNETGQNAGMEPGTYVMYYTENDGPIKIQKVA